MKLSFDFSDSAIHENSKKHLDKGARLLAGLATGQPQGQPIDWFAFPNRHGDGLLDGLERMRGGVACAYDLVVCIGIGGSYLGSRTVYQSLRSEFEDLQSAWAPTGAGRRLPIVYCGHNLAANTQGDLIRLLQHFDPLVVVISKTGETIEPALAFRLVRNCLETKYGHLEAMRRISCVTDAEQGTLRRMAREQSWPSAVVPDGIGGRFSVLTAAGLAPLALAGYDLRPLVTGAQGMFDSLRDAGETHHPAVQYAAYRSAAYNAGKKVDVIASFEGRTRGLLDWYQQLYGESLGKNGRGLFVAPLQYSTDLHSMGQYLQEGERTLTQTMLVFERPAAMSGHAALEVPTDARESGDGLGYLAGRNYHQLNLDACLATMAAHREGGVGTVAIRQPELSLHCLGELFAFFETACAVEGLLQELNPFNQPGVEAYKKNMLGLFGKPGYEEVGRNLRRGLPAGM